MDRQPKSGATPGQTTTTSGDDDIGDIKAGLECLRKGIRSIRNARRAISKVRGSRDGREAEIALAHAEEMAAITERLFSTAVGEESREARNTIGDPRDWGKEGSEQEGE